MKKEREKPKDNCKRSCLACIQNWIYKVKILIGYKHILLQHLREAHVFQQTPLSITHSQAHPKERREGAVQASERMCGPTPYIWSRKGTWGGLQWLKPWTPCSNVISISIKAWTWVFWCSCTVKHYQHWHLESWMQHYKPSRVFIYWFICRNLTHIVTYPFLVCNLQQIYRLEEYSKSSFWKQYVYMHQFSSIWMNWIRLHICLHVLLTL